MKTRRAAVLALMCFLLPMTAFGFDLAVGVKGGVGLPHYGGADYQDILDAGGIATKPRIGFSAGAFVTIGLVDLLAIQPEVMYSAVGGNFGDETAIWYDRASVIEIPVLVKVRLRLGRLTVAPFVGPAALIKLGTWDFEVKDPDGVLLMSGKWLDDQIRVPFFGAVAGAGIELPLSGGVLTFEARYHLGLTSRFTEESGVDWKQNNFQVLVGFGYLVRK